MISSRSFCTHIDPCIADGDDERRGGRSTRAQSQTRIIGRHQEADNEDREDVKDDDPDPDFADRRRDRLFRVPGLGSSERDDFGTDYGEEEPTVSHPLKETVRERCEIRGRHTPGDLLYE